MDAINNHVYLRHRLCGQRLVFVDHADLHVLDGDLGRDLDSDLTISQANQARVLLGGRGVEGDAVEVRGELGLQQVDLEHRPEERQIEGNLIRLIEDISYRHRACSKRSGSRFESHKLWITNFLIGFVI